MKSYIIFFLFFIELLFPQTGNISGKVKDNNESIPSANVSIIDTKFGAICDNEGNFSIKNIPIGSYEIKISAIGFETQYIDIEVEEDKTVELKIILEQQPIEISEVVVVGSKIQQQKDTRTSLLEIKPESAKILPGAGEDVLRTLQSLPGVLAPNDFSSQLVVRGSGPDQNLIIIDGVEIFNPYRLYGFISMFNPDVVSDVSLITGGFPAKYGDRLSAVLDVTNKEGDDNKFIKGSLNASIINANFVLEGKNPFNIKGSWLLNSRRTYYDLIIEPFVKKQGLVKDNVSFPNFYDVQTKLTFGPFNGHKIFLSAIYSEDGTDIVSGEKRRTADSVSINNLTKNNITSISWQYTSKRKFFNSMVASYYINSGGTDFNSQILDPSLNRKDFENVLPDTLSGYLRQLKFNSIFTFNKFSIDDKLTYLWGKNILEGGFGVDFVETIIDFKFQFDNSFLASFPLQRAKLSDLKDIKNYKKYRFYLQNNFAVTENLFFNPGVRLDYYEILKKLYLAPRILLSYALNKLTTIRAVWGIYYQSPGYEKLRDQNVLYDLNIDYTKQLNAEKAIHYIIGIERWLSSEWNFRVEGYYKDFSDLVIQKSVSGSKYFTELIPGKDQKLFSSWTSPVVQKADSLTQIPINGSYGEAYGIEFLLAKRNVEKNSKFNGWISYSYAFANRFERGEIIPFNFDQRHTINIVLNYKFNEIWDVGLKWQYGSGYPFNEPIGIKPRITLIDTDGDKIPETPVVATRKTLKDPNNNEVIYDVDYGNKYRLSGRKGEYHRLDIRITALTNFWNLDWSFYLDIINVYNRSNVINYDYYINSDLTLGREPTNMFPIVPTLGFSLKF